MGEIHQTPDVEEYSRLKVYERARVRHVIGLNAKLLAERAQTLEDEIYEVQATRPLDIARARSKARRAARDEVAKIFADEFARERVRAFETYPLVPMVPGDLKACADEAYEYDIRNRRKA